VVVSLKTLVAVLVHEDCTVAMVIRRTKLVPVAWVVMRPAEAEIPAGVLPWKKTALLVA